MTTHVDTSALLKLLFLEAETLAVRSWFDAGTHGDAVSSLLIRPEAHCATRRRDSSVAASTVDAVLGLVELVDVLAVDLDAAAGGTTRLRAADAIHPRDGGEGGRRRDARARRRTRGCGRRGRIACRRTPLSAFT